MPRRPKLARAPSGWPEHFNYARKTANVWNDRGLESFLPMPGGEEPLPMPGAPLPIPGGEAPLPIPGGERLSAPMLMKPPPVRTPPPQEVGLPPLPLPGLSLPSPGQEVGLPQPLPSPLPGPLPELSRPPLFPREGIPRRRRR